MRLLASSLTMRHLYPAISDLDREARRAGKRVIHVQIEFAVYGMYSTDPLKSRSAESERRDASAELWRGSPKWPSKRSRKLHKWLAGEHCGSSSSAAVDHLHRTPQRASKRVRRACPLPLTRQIKRIY